MSGRRLVIGVMGRGELASHEDISSAEELGERIARERWVLLTGGRDAGVIAAANRGAKRVPDSLTIGVLPARDATDVCAHVDIAIVTGLGDARNAVNVLSSDAVVICGAGGPGTASEAALAIKAQRFLILLNPTPEAAAFFRSLDAAVASARSA